MQKKTRTIIFSACLFLFFIITPSAILYSQGYRLNLKTRRIAKTGGLFLKIVPSSVKIYVNGKLKDKTSLLFNSCLIENLYPRNYQVQAKKDGYYPWQKNIEVKEKQVTEFKNIALIPKNPIFAVLKKNVKDFWFSPSEDKVIYEKIDKKANVWNLELFNVQFRTTSPVLSEKDITQTSKNYQKSKAGPKIIDVKWGPDEKRILLKINIETKTKYFVANLNREQTILFPLNFLGENIEMISFNPKNPEEIFFIMAPKKAKDRGNRGGLLFKVNYAKKTIPRLILGQELSTKVAFNSSGSQKVISYTIWQDQIIWLSSAGLLYRSNIDSGKILEILNQQPYLIKEGKNYQLITMGFRKTFLKENNALYYLCAESKEFKEVSKNVKSLRFSPDLKKIAYYTNSEIWLFYLENTHDQPQRKIQQKVFLGRWTNKISEVYWFTDHYLIFTTGNQIKITETDNRDEINIVDLAKFPSPKLFWNQANKSLYILTNQSIIATKELVP